MVIHENVEEFDWHVLETLLGCIYIVYSTVMEAVDLGWPVWRRRRWTILLHREKARPSSCVVERVVVSYFLHVCSNYVFLRVASSFICLQYLIASVLPYFSLVRFPATFLEEMWDPLVGHAFCRSS